MGKRITGIAGGIAGAGIGSALSYLFGDSIATATGEMARQATQNYAMFIHEVFPGNELGSIACDFSYSSNSVLAGAIVGALLGGAICYDIYNPNKNCLDYNLE